MVSFSCLDMSRAWSSGLATLVAELLLCTGLETSPPSSLDHTTLGG